MAECNKKNIQKAKNFFLESNFLKSKEICLGLIQNDFKNEEVFNLLGLLEFKLTNIKKSKEYFIEALKINSGSIEAENNLSMVLISEGDFSEAEVRLDRLLNRNECKKNCEILSSLAHVSIKLQKYNKALDLFKKISDLNNGSQTDIYWMAICLLNTNKLIEAKELFEQYLTLNPNHLNALSNLAYIHHALKNYNEATNLNRRIISIDKTNSNAYNNLALIFKDLNQLNSAIYYLIKSLKLNQNNFNGYINLGIILQEKKKYLFAKKLFEKAAKINSDAKFILGRLLNINNIICDWSKTSELKEKIIRKIKNNKEAIPSFVCLSNFDDENIHALTAKKWSEQFPQKKETANFNITKNAKPNIGFFSSDFREHAMGYILTDFFKNINHDKYNYFAFYLGPKNNSDTKERIKKSFKRFYELEHLSKTERYELLKKKNLDVAIDLNGYTQYSFTDLFSLKIAKKNVNFLGYPGTLGNKNFDFIIADEITIPSHNKNNYSEKVLWLKNCYQPNDKKRFQNLNLINRQDLGLPDDKFVFGNFNNSFKITEEIFNIWLKLLNTNSNSILLLLESNEIQKRNILNYSKKKKLNKKIFFTKRANQNLHLSKHKIVDLFLDTFPYNGHVSASDALLSGTPYLTIKGNSFQSRVASSILHELELEDLICLNENEYFDKAVKLSLNPDRLKNIKFSLNKKINDSIFFKTKKFALNFEKLIEERILNEL